MDCIYIHTQCNVCERSCRLHILRYDLLYDRSITMGMGLSHMERSCINHVEYRRILVGVAKLLRNTRIGVSVYERCREMVPSSLYAYLSLSRHKLVTSGRIKYLRKSHLTLRIILSYNKYIYGVYYNKE